MIEVNCRGCGKYLPSGSLKYIVQIHITADFDGHISEEEFNEEIPLEQIVENLKKRPAEEAEKDVQESKAFFLCPVCRKSFAKDPFGGRGDPETENLMH